MKIISLLGSPHGVKGNTGRLLQIVSEGAESLGASVETIVLPGDNVLPCRGCDVCHKKGKCIQHDEYEDIKHKILKADGLILASPNYILNVSAQMKAFMDRCCGAVHCLSFEGKYGASVITSGGGDELPIAESMSHFMMITGIKPVGAVWATMGNITEDKFPEDIKNNAFELGKKLVLSWKDKAVFPESEKIIGEFKERMKQLMLWRKEEWPYEYEYWKKHRGLE
jgi:multimeric flavodoxin WrbA